MNIDPRTVVILTVLSTLIMSAGLFAVARGYLAEMRGVSRWALGTLLQSLGWILLALVGVIPEVISELGSPIIMLAMALYFHALSEFKAESRSVLWVYVVVALHLFAMYYFVLIVPHIAARIVVASSTAAILMFASARVLIFHNAKKLPISHVMTGSLFAACSFVLVVRAFYYLVWNNAPDQSTFDQNIIQDIAFLTFFIAAVLSPFTFMLMCNDRYAEKALLRTAELASKNIDLEVASQAKGRFLATMSHELRTPLNGVIGFLKQLGKTQLDPQQKDYLQTIDISARTLLGVINDILDFSKIEAGKLSIEALNVDIRELLDEILAIFTVAAKDKNIHLVCDVEQSVPVYLIADPLRLTQVLSNLVSNAIKFTEQGEVKIEIRLLDKKNDKADIEICVVDTGIGISEESLKKLFQAFGQADASTTRKYGGTGLGLIIARKLVDMMGGSLNVTSKEGQGTRFIMKLALHSADVDSLPKILDAKNTARLCPLQGKRVLVVDDNNINRKLAQLLVKELGGEFDSAENGVQVLEAISNKTYDLILMDVNMPIMDGLEATRRIRAMETSTSRLPIIALTANALPGDKEKFIEIGMDDYLSKPLNEKSLLLLLNKLFPHQENILYQDESMLDESEPEEVASLALPDDLKKIKELPVLDPALGLELSFGDQDAWQMVLGMLLDDLPSYASQFSLAGDNLEEIRHIAHRLAGSSCYCGTAAIYDVSQKLEALCRQGDHAAVIESINLVQQQIERLRHLDVAGKLRTTKIAVY